MVQERVITPQQRDQILTTARRGVDTSCADAIVDLRIMSETDVLKYFANIYRTNFVTTQKLAKAAVDARAIAQVPLKVAERLAVCPILFDIPNQTLAVVTDNFEDDDVAKQIQMSSGVREVKLYLARRGAVRLLIRKFYRNEQSAFLELQMRADPSSQSQSQAMPQGAVPGSPAGYADPSQGYGGGGAYYGSMITQGGVTGYYDAGGAGFGAGGDLGALDPPGSHSSPGAMVPGFGGVPAPSVPAAMPPLAALPAIGAIPGQQVPTPPPPPPDVLDSVLHPPRDRRRSFTIEAPEIVAALKGEVQELQAELKREESNQERTDAVPNTLFLETLNVLVALLENNRGELRGHTAQVARLTRKLCERVGLTESEMHGILAAAYLHDIGKATNYHLTAFNVAQYEGHRARALKTHMTPLRMFDSVNLPESTVKTLTHMYERFDGQGFPGRLVGKDIPLGSRVLAIVETYVDLTTHDKNPARKTLDPKGAFEFMGQIKSAVFDTNLLDLFQLVVLGDDMKAKLLKNSAKVLIVDADPEETTVLELRLVERGMDVVVARSAQDALARVETFKPDVLISEIVLTPMDGFQFVAELKKRKINVPVIFVTSKGDRDTVTKGFELGAKDFVIKPASADVVAAKVEQVLSASVAETKSSARGVQGTLQEMSLPDVIQVLAHGRKSGVLEIRAKGKVGQIMFGEGDIWNAEFGTAKAAEAVYELLTLTDGDFTLDLSKPPGDRVINDSYESLLLEGMRRLDEAGQ
jgi:response regulator RpfG family c-di-GMP phosphodiesterase